MNSADSKSPGQATPQGHIAVVFGAGGIGRALVEALRAVPRFDNVIAFSRGSVPSIELTDEASLEHAARFAADQGELRLVIDATGFLHDERQTPEKTWHDLDAAKLTRAFALNAIGPALLMKHVLPRLPRKGKAAFATLSARVGSIADNRLGGWYAYRASKAALNQLVRTAAIELRRSHPEALCVALHPGTVRTPLSDQFAKSATEVHEPATAAAHLLAVIDRLSHRSSGEFFDWRGERVPW
jgi:NAD(P)-dependent dehydrogenase (short-subunit alcohol dehydrogenase family)